MEILGKMLGSSARVKIMRLFLLNRNQKFDNKDITKRSRVNAGTVRKEIKLLSSIGFIKKRGKGWAFDSAFKYTREMEGLLINTDSIDRGAVASNFRKSGKVKLILISGLFIKNKDSRVDLLVVGDKMKKGKFEEEVRKLEAEIGSELSYALFDTKDFTYRLNMYDKLVRDVLDFPHEIVFQVKELSTQTLKKA